MYPLFPAATQKDDKITKPGVTKPKLKSQNDNSTDPRPTVSALPEPPTHQPRVSGVQGRTGPIAVLASKHDKFIVSEYDLFMSSEGFNALRKWKHVGK